MGTPDAHQTALEGRLRGALEIVHVGPLKEDTKWVLMAHWAQMEKQSRAAITKQGPSPNCSSGTRLH